MKHLVIIISLSLLLCACGEDEDNSMNTPTCGGEISFVFNGESRSYTNSLDGGSGHFLKRPDLGDGFFEFSAIWAGEAFEQFGIISLIEFGDVDCAPEGHIFTMQDAIQNSGILSISYTKGFSNYAVSTGFSDSQNGQITFLSCDPNSRTIEVAFEGDLNLGFGTEVFTLRNGTACLSNLD